MDFINRITDHIAERNIPLQSLTIILPSERAKKYLIAALFKKYKKPILAPNIVTMDNWVKSFCPNAVIDKTRALIQLFEIQLKKAKSIEDTSFDEFLTWGNILLSDFNEIDRYLLDADQVFKNLADIKEIEQWSFGEEQLTESQKRFMEFWDRLPGYYHALKKQLLKNDSCYSGWAFKYLTENIDVLFKEDKKHQFLFAGFNALSKAEITIVKQLINMGRAELLIDADEYYMSNSNHEAGLFLKELSIQLDGKKMEFVQDDLKHKTIKIEMIECAQKTGQVKVASTILEESSKEEINETLLLLADESLINSVIKNLPKKIGKANITLGLPIRNSALRTWVDLIFSLQENRKRFKTASCYFQDFQNFGNHPFLLAVIDDTEKQRLIEEEKQIVKYNRIFFNPGKLKLGDKTTELLNLLTEDWEGDWKKATQIVRSMSKLIFRNLDNTYAFEKAIIQAFDRALVDFENIVGEGLPEMNLRSFKQLFNQHWGMKSIAYHGNPLEGLQIMGLLETRALDFKRIICVGMNEGNLPPTNPIQTMIPMDLRRYLGLPTPRDKQGLFAHHFYRLLHTCEELFVTYCSAEESIGSNEPSRYLMQLEMELSRDNPNVNIEKKIYSLSDEEKDKSTDIEKEVEILNRIDELLERSTSASMLNTYLTCPLDFYFKYVMDFGEADEVEEEIENSTFGTFIHNTLEELYRPFSMRDEEGEMIQPAPTNITSFDVEKMLKEYKVVMHQQFMKHFNNDKESFMKGKNLLTYQMAMELTERFLKSEVKFLSEQTEPVFIEALELKFESMVEVIVAGKTKKVNLRGFIDRIDRIGDKIRIIDYKSGKVNDTDVCFRTSDKTEEQIIESFSNKTSRKHILQLVHYAFLYHQRYGTVPESSIISFISDNNKPFTLYGKQLEMNEVITSYPQYLGKILEDVFDASTPFTHDTSRQFSYCRYCE